MTFRGVASFLFVGSLLAACSNGTQIGDAGSDTGIRTDVAPADVARDVAPIDAGDAAAADVTTTDDGIAMDAPAADAPTTDAPAPIDVVSTDTATVDVASTDVAPVDVITRDVGTSGSCGGRMGLRCGRNEFCSYALADMCGAADQTGVCQPIPSSCTPTAMPVCGCDGTTYTSECEANMAGTSVAATGACATAGDCRTTSCPRGQYCSPCRGIGGTVYVCLPTGTAC